MSRSQDAADAGMPGWVMAAIAWVLVSVASGPGLQVQWPPDSSAGLQPPRRLQAAAPPAPVSSDAVQPPPFELLPPEEGHETLMLTLDVPCYLLVKPCGNVTIPPDGLTIHYPFNLGQYHIPGNQTLTPAIRKAELAFSHYTAIIVAVLVVARIVYKCSKKAVRAKVARKWKNFRAGVLDDDSDDDRADDDPERMKEQEEEMKERLDPKSSDFIAPGNIYRMLAVLHPGKIGWAKWLQFASKGFVCAYMQMYLPYKIIANVLNTWHITGIKSPLWFIENWFSFTAMFASLGSLCHLFQKKCAQHIMDGAEANHFILSRYPDVTPSEANVDDEPPTSVRAENRALLLKPLRPTLPACAVRLNELFWCWMSMILNIAMSMMLQLCMFLKIATFTGAVDGVAIVAVSLYFIFDLDTKVLQDDAKLKMKYRRAVAKLQREYPPDDPKREGARWLTRIAGAWISLSHQVVPLMLLSLVLFAWKNPETKVLIGGSGLDVTAWDD